MSYQKTHLFSDFFDAITAADTPTAVTDVAAVAAAAVAVVAKRPVAPAD